MGLYIYGVMVKLTPSPEECSSILYRQTEEGEKTKREKKDFAMNINTPPQSPCPPLSPAARLHCPSHLPSQGHRLPPRLKPPSQLRLAPRARVCYRTAAPALAVSRACARGWEIEAAVAAAGDLSGPRFPGKMKYVLVTGGVVSGLGKGVTASSIGVVLKSCGLRITSIKIGTCRRRRRRLLFQ